MLRHFLFALVVGAMPAAALACQCEDPGGYSAAEIEERAKWIAGRGFVIAEVERLGTGVPADERYRVLRRLVGNPPDLITVDRFATRLANREVIVGPITSCDYSAPPGFRRVMAFGPRGRPAATCSVLGSPLAAGALAPATMCTQSDLGEPAILKRVLELQAR